MKALSLFYSRFSETVGFMSPNEYLNRDQQPHLLSGLRASLEPASGRRGDHYRNSTTEQLKKNTDITKTALWKMSVIRAGCHFRGRAGPANESISTYLA